MTDTKTILVTGATDGIGLATAKALADAGHRLLLHGRDASKLERAAASLPDGRVAGTYRADLSTLGAVDALSDELIERQAGVDVLINNAGVFNTSQPRTDDGLDVRFAVNTLAPYVLTRRLLPHLGSGGRVVNLSSAAQTPVNLAALRGEGRLSDGEAYAQSKLALTMWTNALAVELGGDGPVVVSVNPGSLLGTKMVRDAFGTSGKSVGIGVDILVRAALSDEFADASGRYYDNDAGRFASAHAEATDLERCRALMSALDEIVARTRS